LFMNLTMVTDLCSIGTLFAFVLVCGGVLVLQNKKDIPRGKFRTPYINGKWVYPGILLVAVVLLFTKYKEETMGFITNEPEVKSVQAVLEQLTPEQMEQLKGSIYRFAHKA